MPTSTRLPIYVKPTILANCYTFVTLCLGYRKLAPESYWAKLFVTLSGVEVNKHPAIPSTPLRMTNNYSV